MNTADETAAIYYNRTETVSEMLEAESNGEEYEGQDAAGAIYELPLAVDRKILIRITLGMGGPGDWIDAICSNYDDGLGIDSATHTAVWGSDRKVTTLNSNDALWKLAERFVDGMEA